MSIDDSQGCEDRKPAVIFDVDGTLCDVRSIRKHVEAPAGTERFRADFHRFHSESAACPPFEEVKRLAIRAHQIGLAILVVTGREDKWRELTIDWLVRNDVPFEALYMRGEKDYRPDQVIKAEIELVVREDFHPLLAVDDRLSIIVVWQAAGIATVQVEMDGAISPVKPNSRAQNLDLFKELSLEVLRNAS